MLSIKPGMKKIICIALTMVLSLGIGNATTKTSIRVTDLSKLITDDIAKNYPDYTIKEAFRVDTNGIISFEIIIQNPSDKWTLSYDNNGKFVKKVKIPPSIAHPKEIHSKKSGSHLVIKK